MRRRRAARCHRRWRGGSRTSTGSAPTNSPRRGRLSCWPIQPDVPTCCERWRAPWLAFAGPATTRPRGCSRPAASWTTPRRSRFRPRSWSDRKTASRRRRAPAGRSTPCPHRHGRRFEKSRTPVTRSVRSSRPPSRSPSPPSSRRRPHMLERSKRKRGAADGAYIAPPVQRAVRLIRHVAEGNPVLNMSETAKALKINRTTLLRLLHTLEIEGFVERRPGGAGFQVGLSLLELGARALFSQDLVQVAMPVLTTLAETLQLSAHLGVLDGTDVLYLVRRAPNTPLASNIRVGSRLPAHATTMGRMLLAFMTPVELETLYAGRELERFSEHTSTTLPALKAKAEKDRREI